MYGIFGLILSTRHQLRSRRSPRHQLPQELFCGWLTDGLLGVGWLTDGLGGVFSLIRSPRHQLRSRRSPRHQLLKTPAPKASVTQAHRQQITLRPPPRCSPFLWRFPGSSRFSVASVCVPFLFLSFPSLTCPFPPLCVP